MANQLLKFGLRDKCLRWRNSLERHLLRRELGGAFAAIERIQNEKESAFENYYDSIGYPKKNYAEKPINFYSGELVFEFSFFNTRDTIESPIIDFFSFLGISLNDYRDKKITDEELARHVGPRAIEYLLNKFIIATDKGVDLALDLTLLASFRQNARLQVSVRQDARTPRTIPRDQIDALVVKLDLNRIEDPVAREGLSQFQNKYMKVTLRSGSLNYRSDIATGTLFRGRIDNDIFPGSDGARLATPLTAEELRNPRGEDVNAANNLLHHLNENLEYYNKCLIFDLTPERRFMLLDGILAPGKAKGRSVASVVENRVIGIAGNSLIMPVAPGYQLDPTIDENFNLFAQYYGDDPDPMRISVPTKGIYAEAVMGKCNCCEEKDESRFWRWEESPIPDSPTTPILPISTDTRRADPGNLQPKDFPAPVVNIQNAPALPDPQGLQNLATLLGKGDAFRDLTGLNQTQLNALATFQKTLETAQSFGKEAAELAKTAATVGLAKEAQKSGALSNEDTKAVVKEALAPDPAKAREENKKDVEEIDAAKQKGQLDEPQAKEMTEDTMRKKQGTTRPAPAAARKGKRKYHLTLLMQDSERRPLVGTFVLNFGSLVEETFETPKDGIVRFDVDLDASRDNILSIRGNPWITGVSLPEDSEFYYHVATHPAETPTNANLTFNIIQRRRKTTVVDSDTASDTQVKTTALQKEFGSQFSASAELNLLVGKIGDSLTITAKRINTESETGSTGSSTTSTATYTVMVPLRTLLIIQKGQPVFDPNIDD